MKKYSMFFLFFFLTGCELIVDLDVPFPGQQLTLNSFFNADSLWTATVSLNQPILDESPATRVEDALVIIYHENTPVDTLAHVVNGVYRSDRGKPVPGSTYEIKASAGEYLPVTGRSHIPFPESITSVDLVDGTNVDGFPEITLNIKFTDDPGAVNYYQLFLEAEYEFVYAPTGEIIAARNRMGFQSDDPIVQNGDEINYDGIFMKDIVFSDGKGTVAVKVGGSSFDFNSAVIVTLRTLSEDYYNYKITGSLQDNTSDNPFAQPVNVYNNIENGFGVFAGFSEMGHTVGEVAPRPVITSIVPTQGKRGDRVVIKGENFGNSFLSSGSVTFAGRSYPALADMVSASENELEVTIPQNAVSGKIYVSNRGKIVASDIEFGVME